MTNIIFKSAVALILTSTALAGRFSIHDMRNPDRWRHAGGISPEYARLTELQSPLAGGHLAEATIDKDGPLYLWQAGGPDQPEVKVVRQRPSPAGNRLQTSFSSYYGLSDNLPYSLLCTAERKGDELVVTGRVGARPFRMNGLKDYKNITDFEVVGVRGTSPGDLVMHMRSESMAYELRISTNVDYIRTGMLEGDPDIVSYRINDLTAMPPELRSFVQNTDINEVPKGFDQTIKDIGEEGGFGTSPIAQ